MSRSDSVWTTAPSRPTWSEASSRRAALELLLVADRVERGVKQVLEDQPDHRDQADHREVVSLIGEGDAGGEQAGGELDGQDRHVDIAQAPRIDQPSKTLKSTATSTKFIAFVTMKTANTSRKNAAGPLLSRPGPPISSNATPPTSGKKA